MASEKIILKEGVKEGIRRLPRDIQKRYFANVKAQDGVKVILPNITYRVLIKGAFVWNLTPEGYDFWDKINEEYEPKESL